MTTEELLQCWHCQQGHRAAEELSLPAIHQHTSTSHGSLPQPLSLIKTEMKICDRVKGNWMNVSDALEPENMATCKKKKKAKGWSQQLRGPVGDWVHYWDHAVGKGWTPHHKWWMAYNQRCTCRQNVGTASLRRGQHLIYVDVTADKCWRSNDSAICTWVKSKAIS